MSALEHPGGIRMIANQLVKGGAVDYDAIMANGTQISVLNNLPDVGLVLVVRIVGQLITAFQKSFNIYAPMDDGQIADMAVDLVHDFWAYKLEDFVAFFHGARKGYYGEIKNRLDEQVILGLLKVYDRERLKHLEEKQISLKTLELPGGEQRKADPMSRSFDGMIGAIAEIKGGILKQAGAMEMPITKPRKNGK